MPMLIIVDNSCNIRERGEIALIAPSLYPPHQK